MTDYELIVGMEIHVELKTKSKMFCGCKNDPFFAAKPNIYTCPVCLGMPGGLPLPNRKAVEWTIRLGLALGCEIPLLSKFDRKNYFYPDLAKGYQISQYDMPLAIHGKVETEYGTVRIHRVHLEEDTGKLLHTKITGNDATLVDFNRSGVPLMEIVTEPDIRSGDQAKSFLKKLHQIIRYLDISDADMEKGSMRLEPNISLRPQGEKNLPNYKVEVKNINSFNFVKKAIEFEVERHTGILNKGEIPVQETRGWKDDKGITVSQRVKENADDYRYFPEPDIPPMRWTKEFIHNLKESLPELPDKKSLRFSEAYALNEKDTELLVESFKTADYFEEAVRVAGDKISPKTIANWMINRNIDLENVMPAKLVSRIIEAEQKTDISDIDLNTIITKVIGDNKSAVEQYKSGKIGVLMFLVGQVFKTSKLKLDGKIIAEKIKSKIS
jgi:aspartyl-tRNA(Asn)/glutamyl-tRNA(Gln) amidotransferase subunit B